MIKEKDIQTRIAEILNGNGFNVVATEVDEGFDKPAVFVSVFPASVKLHACGGATEEVTDSVEIKYISAAETVEDCIATAEKMKRMFLYAPFDIQDRHLTIQGMEFDVEKTALYVYFDITFIQPVDTAEEYETMENLQIIGGNI